MPAVGWHRPFRPVGNHIVATDLLESLADQAVPPVPAQRTFVAGVRRKLNPRLLVAQIIEFAVGVMAWAVLHMAMALLGALRYTVTGAWPEAHDRREHGHDR